MTAINSHGVRFFRSFSATWDVNDVELHECSLPIIDAINTFSGMLGGPGSNSRVKSVNIPVRCNSCGNSALVLVKIDAGKMPQMPTKVCNCGQKMSIEGDVDDFFSFIEAT